MGRNHTTETKFELPQTIEGMKARLSVLNQEIDDISAQLESKEVYATFHNDRAWQAWAKKAKVARQYRRAERAWLVDHYQSKIEENRKTGKELHARTEDERAQAKERRRQRLASWVESHPEEPFLALMSAMYVIAVDVEQGENGESPFDEYELNVLRTVRAFLKENGMACTMEV
jgi:hypothetical protein